MQRRARRKKRVKKVVDIEVQERASMTRTQITIMTQKRRRRVLAMIQKMVQRLIMMRRRKRNTTRNLVLVQMMILKMIGRKSSVERALVMIPILIQIVAMARRKPNMQRMIEVKERRYQ
jgi:hypothetical protein